LIIYLESWALISLGNYTGAIHYLDKALAIDPNDKLALSHKLSAQTKITMQTSLQPTLPPGKGQKSHKFGTLE
jgi:tetratricopeptide (TPR) repeat protein